MKKYMIVGLDDVGQPITSFTDDYGDALQIRQDIECGLGGYAEIYERRRKDAYSRGRYVLLEA